MAGKITVVGLGAGDMNQLTLGVYKRLTQAEVLYVRTKDHPLIEDLKKEIAEIHFFDEVYEMAMDYARPDSSIIKITKDDIPLIRKVLKSIHPKL